MLLHGKMVKPLDYVIEHLGTCRARVRRDRGRGVRWPDSPVPSIHLFKTLFSEAVVEIGTPRKTIWVIPSNQLIMLESNAGGTENNDEGKGKSEKQ